MQSQAQRVISLFRTIVLAAVAALLITSVALPMSAQNSVPPSASQAARMPEFAKRLAHPATQRMPAKSPVSILSDRGRRLPPVNGVAYDNGPVNGQVDAWTIGFGFSVSDTMQVNASVTGIQFWAWLEPGDTISTVEVQIGSNGYFSNNLFDQVVNNLTQSSCFTNNFGFDVCLVSGNFTGPNLNGNDWITLANASTVDGNPVYWDENSGVGCQSPGCPSQAQENTIGTIPSEAFSMQGNGQSTCFQSGGNLQIISNFTQQQGGSYPANGVTLDSAGNLYGTTANGGDNSAGFAFKLTHFTDWLLDPLFSFFGGDSGGLPSGLIVGPNGSLYGGAQGGIQNCGGDGSQYCGLVFNLRPQSSACLTALCSWTENVPYRFSSESDGSGTINVSASDQAGNLYGTTSTGGAHGAGTVFELTPSGGGWTKTTLYSFTGGVDADPTQVLAGNDGNLYGVANGAYPSDGIVFQLTPSGGHWTESVLHMFLHSKGFDPAYLVQDSAGNLYGILLASGAAGTMFVLQKSSGWAISEYLTQHSCQPEDLPFDNLSNLTIDAAGNLYGTGAGGEGDLRGSGKKGPGDPGCRYGYIFKARYDSSGWHYQDLDFLLNTIFPSRGSLALDPSGNLYGATDGCGTNNAGTVWQFSP
jgi:uncharacterized repeat protein (TIGR03803 family)